MSDNSSSSRPKLDPRTRRTRDVLGDALVELVQERPFDSITVQDVLDRAGVSRSTFYLHYKDKDDLFFSDADDFFEHFANAPLVQDAGRMRVAPVRELLAHVADARAFFDAVLASGRSHDLRELGEAHFARAIDRRLQDQPTWAGLSVQRRELLSRLLSSALFSLLFEWIRDPSRRPPAEMDELFHSLVWTGVAPS